MRRCVVSGARRHDGQKFEDILDTLNPASDAWAKRAKGSVKRSLMEWRAEGGSAYRSREIEEKLGRRGLKSRIHRSAYRNRERSRGARGRQYDALEGARPRRACIWRSKNAMGAEIVRTIGLVRARCKIGMTTLVYNMRRFIFLEGMAAVAGRTGAPRGAGACVG